MSTVSILATLALVALGACSAGNGELAPPGSSSSSAPTTTPTTAARTEAGCPTVTGLDSLGRLANPELTETSGLAASALNPEVLWAHNDSGGAASFFAVGRDGADLGEFPLEGVENRDWEDMARWLDPATDTNWLYVGDIGDNVGQWESIFVHRVPEPPVTGSDDAQTLGGAETFELIYPEGAPNAETLIIDPAGTITIVTKNPGGATQVYEAVGAVPGTPHQLTEAGTLNLGGSLDGAVTAGDHGGDHVFIRTYLSVLAYSTQAGPWWASEPCELDPPFEIQGEALGAELDGSGYVTVSEGSRARLTRSQLN